MFRDRPILKGVLRRIDGRRSVLHTTLTAEQSISSALNRLSGFRTSLVYIAPYHQDVEVALLTIGLCELMEASWVSPNDGGRSSLWGF